MRDHSAWLAVPLAMLLAGCLSPGGGPVGDPGGVHDVGPGGLVVVHFAFEIESDRDKVPGYHIGAHCPMSSWTEDPASATVYVGPHGSPPSNVVMRSLEPGQSVANVTHQGSYPTALPGGDAIELPAALDPHRDLGTVLFRPGNADLDGVPIPTDDWLVVEREYDTLSGPVNETLRLRYFPDATLRVDTRGPWCD